MDDYESLLKADLELLARVRTRLLAKISRSPKAAHSTVRLDEGKWQPLCPGVECKVLHRADGMTSALYRLAPGARVPAHPHHADEECVVLQGTLKMGDVTLQAGDYHLARRGIPHAEAKSDEGALFYLRHRDAA